MSDQDSKADSFDQSSTSPSEHEASPTRSPSSTNVNSGSGLMLVSNGSPGVVDLRPTFDHSSSSSSAQSTAQRSGAVSSSASFEAAAVAAAAAAVVQAGGSMDAAAAAAATAAATVAATTAAALQAQTARAAAQEAAAVHAAMQAAIDAAAVQAAEAAAIQAAADAVAISTEAAVEAAAEAAAVVQAAADAAAVVQAAAEAAAVVQAAADAAAEIQALQVFDDRVGHPHVPGLLTAQTLLLCTTYFFFAGVDADLMFTLPTFTGAAAYFSGAEIPIVIPSFLLFYLDAQHAYYPMWTALIRDQCPALVPQLASGRTWADRTRLLLASGRGARLVASYFHYVLVFYYFGYFQSHFPGAVVTADVVYMIIARLFRQPLLRRLGFDFAMAPFGRASLLDSIFLEASTAYQLASEGPSVGNVLGVDQGLLVQVQWRARQARPLAPVQLLSNVRCVSPPSTTASQSLVPAHLAGPRLGVPSSASRDAPTLIRAGLIDEVLNRSGAQPSTTPFQVVTDIDLSQPCFQTRPAAGAGAAQVPETRFSPSSPARHPNQSPNPFDMSPNTHDALGAMENVESISGAAVTVRSANCSLATLMYVLNTATLAMFFGAAAAAAFEVGTMFHIVETLQAWLNEIADGLMAFAGGGAGAWTIAHCDRMLGGVLSLARGSSHQLWRGLIGHSSTPYTLAVVVMMRTPVLIVIRTTTAALTVAAPVLRAPPRHAWASAGAGVAAVLPDTPQALLVTHGVDAAQCALLIYFLLAPDCAALRHHLFTAMGISEAAQRIPGRHLVRDRDDFSGNLETCQVAFLALGTLVNLLPFCVLDETSLLFSFLLHSRGAVPGVFGYTLPFFLARHIRTHFDTVGLSVVGLDAYVRLIITILLPSRQPRSPLIPPSFFDLRFLAGRATSSLGGWKTHLVVLGLLLGPAAPFVVGITIFVKSLQFEALHDQPSMFQGVLAAHTLASLRRALLHMSSEAITPPPSSFYEAPSIISVVLGLRTVPSGRSLPGAAPTPPVQPYRSDLSPPLPPYAVEVPPDLPAPTGRLPGWRRRSDHHRYQTFVNFQGPGKGPEMARYVAAWNRSHLPWDLCHQWIFTMDPDAPTPAEQCPSPAGVYCRNPAYKLQHTQLNNVRNFLRDPAIADTVARLRSFARTEGFTEAYRQIDGRRNH